MLTCGLDHLWPHYTPLSLHVKGGRRGKESIGLSPPAGRGAEISGAEGKALRAPSIRTIGIGAGGGMGLDPQTPLVPLEQRK